jgi:hypothetical protein
MPTWLDGLRHTDWLIDGTPIRGESLIALWNDLDWSKAWVDMGPSPMGNPGPYWHVPLKSGDTTHRLYPKLLQSKWLNVVTQAVEEMLARPRGRQRIPQLSFQSLGNVAPPDLPMPPINPPDRDLIGCLAIPLMRPKQ